MTLLYKPFQGNPQNKESGEKLFYPGVVRQVHRPLPTC